MQISICLVAAFASTVAAVAAVAEASDAVAADADAADASDGLIASFGSVDDLVCFSNGPEVALIAK